MKSERLQLLVARVFVKEDMNKSIIDSVSLKFLKSHALFGGIEDDDLIFILSLMRQENHSEGDEIVREGETGDCLYLIVEGSVENFKKSFKCIVGIKRENCYPGDRRNLRRNGDR